jgi:hypothetical protein
MPSSIRMNSVTPSSLSLISLRRFRVWFGPRLTGLRLKLEATFREVLTVFDDHHLEKGTPMGRWGIRVFRPVGRCRGTASMFRRCDFRGVCRSSAIAGAPGLYPPRSIAIRPDVVPSLVGLPIPDNWRVRLEPGRVLVAEGEQDLSSVVAESGEAVATL